MDRYKIPYVKTFEYTKIVGVENIEFGKHIIIDDFTFIYAKEKIKLGSYVHIACFSSITGGDRVEVGDFSAISQGCRILTATDDFKEWGFGNSTVDNRFRNITQKPIKIGSFCIVGANSVIMPGVTIGDGVTIGANSVVTKDLDSWGIYIGNKRIKERNREDVLTNFSKFENEVDLNSKVGVLFKK